eukprot:gnl/MRDRNA2_/MRDRNA2_61361_c0_seq2.p1 gnl/MRDRNA2_/MRDRNA2_61361_c0~~gnl/MRDRNA2_/MRDRNA2_61361_c0_seq2.p1  ORF type:complete len:245 (+),score=46.27 gnl/MRDRNA2_/MRDRNA2_61361_c0_seq2:107-841(+)
MANAFCSLVCCSGSKPLGTNEMVQDREPPIHMQFSGHYLMALDEEMDVKHDILYKEAKEQVDVVDMDAPRMQVLFSESEKANAVTRTVTFVDRPLGLSFKNSTPIIVSTVDDAAARLDVKPGWVIKALNGQDITGMKYDEVFQLLMFHMSKLPVANPVVKIMFDAGKDYYLPIVFTRKPLGIGISGFPLKVCSVEAGGAASLKAIKPGWQIISINDKDVTRAPIETFEQAVDVFQNAVSKLSQT